MRIATTALVLGFSLPSWVVSARVKPVSLDSLIWDSQRIVVGKVVEIRTVEKLTIARFKVRQTLKGTAEEEVLVLAEQVGSDWIMHLEVGESDAMFLVEPTKDQEAPTLRVDLDLEFGDEPYYWVAYAARGRAPIEESTIRLEPSVILGESERELRPDGLPVEALMSRIAIVQQMKTRPPG